MDPKLLCNGGVTVRLQDVPVQVHLCSQNFICCENLGDSIPSPEEIGDLHLWSARPQEAIQEKYVLLKAWENDWSSYIKKTT